MIYHIFSIYSVTIETNKKRRSYDVIATQIRKAEQRALKFHMKLYPNEKLEHMRSYCKSQMDIGMPETTYIRGAGYENIKQVKEEVVKPTVGRRKKYESSNLIRKID